MKIRLNQKGIAHYFLPLAVVVLFAIGGTAYLVSSHADTPTATTTTSSSTSTTYTTIFTANSATVNFTNSNIISASVQNTGSQQSSVIQIGPSGYVAFGTKGGGTPTDKSYCYLLEPVGGGIGTSVKATVTLNGPSSSRKLTLNGGPESNLGIYQEVCVNNVTTSPTNPPGVLNNGTTPVNLYEAFHKYSLPNN